MKRRSCDHVPHAPQRPVHAHAADAVREPKPDASSVPLDQPAERAVIDQRAADGLDSAGFVQRLAPNEDASPGGARRSSENVIDPSKRVQLGEEVDECGDQQAIPERVDPQPGHQRDQVEPVVRRLSYERSEYARVMLDVGVCEPEVLRCTRERGALMQRPHLASPTMRQRLP